MLKSLNTLADVVSYFKDEDTCLRYLEKKIWHGKPVSPFDRDSTVYRCQGHMYKCRNTGKMFNVRYGTMFHRSSVPLRKWFMAIWLFMHHRKGISSVQLGRDIGVTQKTAWSMLHRMRKCFGDANGTRLFGVVQIDETFVGGKNKNRHWDKKVRNSQGRSFKDKTPVFGMLQQGGRVVAKVVRDTKAATLRKEINKTIRAGSTVFSDEWNYGNLHRRYHHAFVDHRRRQYVSGEVTTNGIESFWATLKRGIIGIYHHVSRKYLQGYVDEFAFRYNTRNLEPRNSFALFLRNTRYIRLKNLTYAC